MSKALLPAFIDLFALTAATFLLRMSNMEDPAKALDLNLARIQRGAAETRLDGAVLLSITEEGKILCPEGTLLVMEEEEEGLRSMVYAKRVVLQAEQSLAVQALAEAIARIRLCEPSGISLRVKEGFE